MKFRFFVLSLTISSFLLSGFADDNSKKQSSNGETVSKPLTDKQKKAKEKQLRKELETPYKKWLNEDVAYIITDEERTAFKRLQTDEEREQFIEQFWLRRDPTPDTVENEFKEEHYRRIAYANDHYASGIPGWKTDRGRIYIMYGPADEIESHPSGGTYERPPEEGGGETSTFPFEQWRYRYIEGIGTNIVIEFVDTTMSGEYHMTMDPSEKDALLYVPGAGLTLSEQMGLSTKTSRFNNTDGTHLGQPLGGLPESMNEFSRLEQFAKLQKPPAIKYKDLEAVVGSIIKFNVLPMRVQVDYVRVTNSTVIANITVQFNNKDLQFTNKDGVQKAMIHVLGRITSMTRRPINTFEREISRDAPNELLQQVAAQQSIFQESVPLTPGLYRLNVVAKDVIAGNVADTEIKLDVPHYDDEKLGQSSLILSDIIEKVPTKSIGTGMFVIGDTKVRPRLGDDAAHVTFRRDEKMGIYAQFYNFGLDDRTHKPNAEIQYEIVKSGSNEKIIDFTEAVSSIPGASGSQVTIEKLLPLKTLAPGQYELKMKVVDKIRNQTLTPSAKFTVS
jgi:GWxTD domain-containing protein